MYANLYVIVYILIVATRTKPKWEAMLMLSQRIRFLAWVIEGYGICFRESTQLYSIIRNLRNVTFPSDQAFDMGC